jgi:hypothetical protein
VDWRTADFDVQACLASDTEGASSADLREARDAGKKGETHAAMDPIGAPLS